jgi:hypothetical protein
MFQFRRIGMPYPVIFTRAAREPVHMNNYGPLRKRLETRGVMCILYGSHTVELQQL